MKNKILGESWIFRMMNVVRQSEEIHKWTKQKQSEKKFTLKWNKAREYLISLYREALITFGDGIKRIFVDRVLFAPNR